MAKVWEIFENVGPGGRSWVQCWPGVASFNHLTLDVSDLGANGRGSEVPDAAAEGRVSTHDEVDEQRCVAVQPVIGDAGDQEEQADPGIVRADAALWVQFKDPESGRVWWWHSKSCEWSWNPPKVIHCCDPAMSLEPTAALITGTSDEPSMKGFLKNS